jgi:hypothetical protein
MNDFESPLRAKKKSKMNSKELRKKYEIKAPVGFICEKEGTNPHPRPHLSLSLSQNKPIGCFKLVFLLSSFALIFEFVWARKRLSTIT